jgi:hypothetical protein
MRLRKVLLAMLAASLGLAATAASAAAAPTASVVMTGLDNPRGLVFGPREALYVAEAGRGGDRSCGGGPDGGEVFFGQTGAVSRLLRGHQERISTGLPSIAEEGGVGATGPHSLDFRGRNGRLTIGLGGDPAVRGSCGPGSDQFGWVAKIDEDGDWSLRDDVAAHEAEENPDGGEIDSNPYGLLKSGEGSLVTDAGGNALVHVSPKSETTTLAVFPSRSTGRDTDSVPTTVVEGPDGALYVGELTGFPFPVGGANVYRVVPPAAPQVYLTGFTGIIDLAWGRDGSLYVLQFATEPFLSGPGSLIRVAPDGTRTTVWGGLVAPTSVALDRAGDAYISNCGVFPGSGPFPCNGHVLKIDL